MHSYSHTLHPYTLCLPRQSSIKARRASSAATSYRRSAVVRYKPAYDATVTPVELRNHNLYIQ